jgi:hypothetical protein
LLQDDSFSSAENPPVRVPFTGVSSTKEDYKAPPLEAYQKPAMLDTSLTPSSQTNPRSVLMRKLVLAVALKSPSYEEWLYARMLAFDKVDQSAPSSCIFLCSPQVADVSVAAEQ